MTWYVYATIAAFFTALGSIIEKRKLEHIHSVDFVVIQALLAGIFTTPILFLFPPSILDFRIIGIAYGVSLLATIAMIDVVRGVRHLEISESAPLFLLNPLFTVLLGFLFLGERLLPIQVGGILLILCGTYFLESDKIRDFRGFWKNLTGDHYARLIILGMLIYSTTSILDRVALQRLGADPLYYLAYLQLFLALNFSAFFFYHKGSLLKLREILRRDWKSMFLIAFLTTAQRLMFAEAMKLASAGLVTTVKRSSSLFTTIIGGELLHDHQLLRKGIACTIMIIGVLLVSGVTL